MGWAQGREQAKETLAFPSLYHLIPVSSPPFAGPNWEPASLGEKKKSAWRILTPTAKQEKQIWVQIRGQTGHSRPHPPSVPPAAPGPRVPGPGSQATLTQDAAERPLPLYLGATGPHLVWRLFGHAAADPGHACHLAAAVHGLQLEASRYRLGLGGSGNPHRPLASTLGEGLPAAAWGRAQAPAATCSLGVGARF